MKNLNKFGVLELDYNESLTIGGGNYIKEYFRLVAEGYRGLWDGLTGK